jgi:NAD(P)H-hydrate epimerase
MLVTSAEMRALEERAFAKGATAEALMEEAGVKIADVVMQFFPTPGRCRAVFGKGHNGGDALVAARHLAKRGWRIFTDAPFDEAGWSPLTRKKFGELTNSSPAERFFPGEIVLDGLLGIGAAGALRGRVAEAARTINHMREQNARVFAIDVPTGVDTDTGAVAADAVVADFTVTIGFAKRGLLGDGATNHVGRLCVAPLDALDDAALDAGPPASTAAVATAQLLSQNFPRRNFNIHKGACGRVAIVAGSRGMTGAAAMCARACVRAGAGLVTLITTEDLQEMLATIAPPEVMVRTVKSYREVLGADFDVIGIGPGLGDRHADDVIAVITGATAPVVVDADAVNAISHQVSLLDQCAGPRLLTPHPGEMLRLDPESGRRPRLATAEVFMKRWPHALLLKGARTLVAQQGRGISYNTTGNPGMATGGMGDVLTGVCAALAAQKLSMFDSARIGAWICGRAAERAVFHGPESEESLCATDIIDHLGSAFTDLRAAIY